jgi:hypothetical protein
MENTIILVLGLLSKFRGKNGLETTQVDDPHSIIRECLIREWMENYSIMFDNLHRKQFVYRQSAFRALPCWNEPAPPSFYSSYFQYKSSDCVRAPSTHGSAVV